MKISPSSLSGASPKRRGARTFVFSILAVGLVFGSTGLAGAATTTRPFANTSPFNTPIRATPVIDPNSKEMAARATRTGMVHANLFEFGIPMYSATASTPRYRVDCTGPSSWGDCPLEAGPLPIPSGAAPNVGSDGVMTVMDSSTNTVSEYWQAFKAPTGEWTATWGAINSMSGSGWGGSSTGAGASRIGGVVRVAEIQAGVIDHALVMQSDNVCEGVYRAPAVKTDGDSSRADCIPEGARLQLDPRIDVDAIEGITPGERAVAKAMQVYGAYLIDRANTSLSVSFELAPDATWSTPGAVYEAAGFRWDFYGMPNVPWDKLRVLNTWNG